MMEPVRQLAKELPQERVGVTTPSVHIRFTGTPGAGLSTRVAALPLVPGRRDGQNGEFAWHEVDKAGRAYGRRSEQEDSGRNLLLHLLTAPRSESDMTPGPTGDQLRRLRFEKGSVAGEVELLEQHIDDLIKDLQDAKHGSDLAISALVICLPIHQHSGASPKMKSLLRLLREKLWSDASEHMPWIIFDITQYDRMFQTLLPEMLDRTPRDLAIALDVRQRAIRGFYESWLEPREILELADLEEKRRKAAKGRPRIVFQVSSAWGFLRGASPPADRGIANIELHGLAERPRIPSISREIAPQLASMVSGKHPGFPVPLAARNELERAGRLLEEFWDPIGIADPVLTVMQDAPRPGAIPLLALANGEDAVPSDDPSGGGPSGDTGESQRVRGWWKKILRG